MKRTFVVAGANGFMGNRFVLEALRHKHSVIALARDSKTMTAEKRVLKEMEDIASHAEIASLKDGLKVYDYDIRKEDLGLTPHVRKMIKDFASDVFNFCGDTTFFPKDVKSLYVTNVDGLVHLVDTLCCGGAIFYHVSTAYVAGRRTGTILENELDKGQEFKNDYEQSKFNGERKVHEICGSRAIKYSIFRPSIVIRGHLIEGKIPNLNHFYSVIGLTEIMRKDAIKRGEPKGKDGVLSVPLRVLGDKTSTLNFVDLDYAIKAILHIAMKEHHENTTYHLVNRHPMTNQQFLDALMKLYGMRGFEWVKDKKDFEHMTLKERLVQRGMSNYVDYCFGRLDFDDRNTYKALEGSGIESPAFTIEYLASASGARI